MASSARSMEEFSMAFVTAPNQEKAKELASGLVRLVLRNLLIGTYLLFLDFFIFGA